MTLAMAAVGDLVAPRERGRYQGYIAATFAVATIVGPLLGGVLVDHASWRWVFLVNLPIGVAALAGLHLRLPAPDAAGADRPLDVSGAALLAGATSALMLTCIWGGSRYAWDSAPILALIAATVVLSGGPARARAPRRRPDRPLPPAAHRAGRHRQRRAVPRDRRAVLGHRLRAAVPADDDRRDPDRGRAAAGAGDARHHGLDDAVRARIARTGRYKRFPIAGLALMTAALVLLAALAGDPSQVATGIALAVFGLGFGMVTQVLIVAVQNSVERRELGVATATTGFFRALGGAVGAAVLGAVFAAQAGGPRGRRGRACAPTSSTASRPCSSSPRRSPRWRCSSCWRLPEPPLQTANRKS